MPHVYGNVASAERFVWQTTFKISVARAVNKERLKGPDWEPLRSGSVLELKRFIASPCETEAQAMILSEAVDKRGACELCKRKLVNRCNNRKPSGLSKSISGHNRRSKIQGKDGGILEWLYWGDFIKKLGVECSERFAHEMDVGCELTRKFCLHVNDKHR